MGKIFLLEPDRMLRQAFVVALFPDFEILSGESLPQTMPSDLAAMIIDAATLKQGNAKLAELIRWPVPVLWIEGISSCEPPRLDRCVRIQLPVSKDALRRALTECLSRGMALETPVGPQVSESRTATKAKRKTRKSVDDEVPDETGNFIELVDVVEEETA